MPDPIKLTIDSALEVDGREDTTQLMVQGHTTQSQPLQAWQNAGGIPLAQMAGDGRLQLGDLGLETDDALLEANADIVLPSIRPQRGWHSLGRITGTLANAVAWIVHELELLGSGGVSGIHTALRAKLRLNNSGGASLADIRAGEFEISNSANPVGKASGVIAILTNLSGGNLTDAAAFRVAAPINQGTMTTLIGLDIPDLTQATQNYAIRTGTGRVSLGDFIEIKQLTASPGAATGVVRVYPKTDGKLYAKRPDGTEYDLTSGGDAADVTYTPVEQTNWNANADPGDVDAALDQLASRVKAVESGISSGLATQPSVLNGAITIAANRNAVLCGPISVSGTLAVEGAVLIL